MYFKIFPYVKKNKLKHYLFIFFFLPEKKNDLTGIVRGSKGCARMAQYKKGNLHQREMPPPPADALVSGSPRFAAGHFVCF